MINWVAYFLGVSVVIKEWFWIEGYDVVSLKPVDITSENTHLWPFSKSKFNLKSDRVNLVAPASPIECLL